MHSCLVVAGKILIDCGLDWLTRIETLKPEAIVLTHAHVDHAGGLKQGALCEVFAIPETWERLRRYPIRDRRVIRVRRPFRIAGITLEAFAVEHSLVAPAVGYRIMDKGVSIFYVPDVVSIPERHDAMSKIDVYIGDGAAITRPIVRRRGDAAIGHTSIRSQLDWCREEGVSRAIITHCGSEIVKGDPGDVNAKIAALGAARGVEATVAHDGLEIMIRKDVRTRPKGPRATPR